MSLKKLIWIIVAWVLLTLAEYYFVPFFILALEWLIMSLVFLIWTIIQFGKVIDEQKASRQRLLSTFTIFTLFILTLFRQPVHRLIEKVDWHIFYSKRCDLVTQVKEGKLKSNIKDKSWEYELPYKFPVISNGGNNFLITKNDSTGNVTVTFWVFRNYCNSPSIHLVYTNDIEEMELLNNWVKNNPQDNWRINENWYRTVHD